MFGSSTPSGNHVRCRVVYSSSSFARSSITDAELDTLRRLWAFPSLFTLAQYVADLDTCGFEVLLAEDRTRARELFARKVLGTTAATETTGVLVSTGGTRLVLDVSAVPLTDGERVVGVFGLLSGSHDELSTPPAHLTPRQAEVLRLLEQGRSTKQIAQELHLSAETVKNHVRNLLRALGVNSRLEAVAAVRRS